MDLHTPIMVILDIDIHTPIMSILDCLHTPAIMILEIEVMDARSGSCHGQKEDIHHHQSRERELEVRPSWTTPGLHAALVIFTEPGVYMYVNIYSKFNIEGDSLFADDFSRQTFFHLFLGKLRITPVGGCVVEGMCQKHTGGISVDI